MAELDVVALALVEHSQWDDDGAVRPWVSEKTDTCVCATFLGLFEYFDYGHPSAATDCSAPSSPNSVRTAVGTVTTTRR